MPTPPPATHRVCVALEQFSQKKKNNKKKNKMQKKRITEARLE